MERTVTFTELKQNLRAIKEAAREDVLHVLTNGRPGYVLCSFEVWERRMELAARRGAYRAHAEESIREGERDVREGRVSLMTKSVVLDDDIADRVDVTSSALQRVDVEYDGESRALLGQALSELARRPTMGLAIDVEYQPTNLHIKKFFSPPCDILYAANKDGHLIVYGLVRPPSGIPPQS